MLISNPAERRESAERKRRSILRFLRDETWSTGDVLQQVAGVTTRQAIHKTLVQLEKGEFVKRHILAVGGRSEATLWGITPHGLAFAWDEKESLQERPYFDTSRVTVSRVPHQVDLQRARVAAEAAGWTEWTRGERLGFKAELRPDAIAVRPDGVRVALEVERTIKTTKRYQVIIREHMKNITAGRYGGVLYLCPEQVTPRLSRIFDAIEYVVIDGERVKLEDKHRRRFKFMNLKDFPS